MSAKRTNYNRGNSRKSGMNTAVNSVNAPMSLNVSSRVQLPPPFKGATENEQYMWLNNCKLHISPEIQRKLNPARVRDIAQNFNPRIANPIKVSYRDEQYFIFDGMHTRTAMALLYGGDDFPIFCRVYYDLTREDEARLFSEQFGFSEPVSTLYRLRALAMAKDPTVLDFLKVTRDAGFSISLDGHVAYHGNISAVVTAFGVCCALGSDTYGRMMRMLHKTWAGENWSVNKYVLGGMARFMKMYEVTEDAFVKAFREVTYAEIKDEAARFPGMTSDGAYAAALAEIYERSTSTNLKECG